tara:strand:- start:1840 stop:2694 length:855 start_codon:yes stop_codon:yes gene_type:complete
MNYKQIKKLPREYIEKKIKEFLEEDIPKGDITTDHIYNNETIEAHIVAAQKLIFCGKDIVETIFNKNSVVVDIVEDGKKIKKNMIIGKIKGPAKEILKKERVMLNLIQRLSAISTKTDRITRKAKSHGIKILDTRKTTPGLRLFEKYAVKVGGGYNHRMDLSSGIMVKDNHIIAAGNIQKAIAKIKNCKTEAKIELEVDYLYQIKQGLENKVAGFLLDNMAPGKIKEAVKLIKRKNKKIFIEASGGITEKSIELYLNTGIDAVSMGEITHSIKNIDIKLEFIRN